MKPRAVLLAASLAVLLVALMPGAASAQAVAGEARQGQVRLSETRFASIDPVLEALIPVYRKNQAPAIVRRALADLRRKCAKLTRSDRLQWALMRECRSIIRLNQVTMKMGRCRGYRGCAEVISRAGREFGRSRLVIRASNAIYRRQLRGGCLRSFLTPKRDLHLLNRLRFRAGRLSSALARRDFLDIFVEQLLWDQLLQSVGDEGPTARESWRAFRAACQPTDTSRASTD